MGHSGEQPDVADDFKMLSLPDVTLVCVDDDYRRGMKAIGESIKGKEASSVTRRFIYESLSSISLPAILLS